MSIADVGVFIRRAFFFLRRTDAVHARMRLDSDRKSDTIIPRPPHSSRCPNRCRLSQGLPYRVRVPQSPSVSSR